MSEIWDAWRIHSIPESLKNDPTGRIREARKKRQAAEQWVLNRIKETAPALLEGHPDSPPSRKHVDDLLAEINSAKGREQKWRRNYLLRVLNRGARELHWPAFDYAPTVALHLRGSPINSYTFPMIGRFRHLREAFIRHLLKLETSTNSAPPADSEPTREPNDLLRRQGQILLSCILFGGLANRARILGVAENGLKHICVHRDWIWIEWKESAEGATERWQRWMPDSLSALLLAKALIDEFGQLQPAIDSRKPLAAIWVAVRAALDELPLEKEAKPTSLSMLLDWSRAWLFRYLPPFLAEYATGKLESASLPPTPWRRLIEGRPIRNLQEIRPDRPADSSSHGPHYNRSPKLPADLEESTVALRNILRGKIAGGKPSEKRTRSAHKIHHAIYAFRQQENLPPIVQLLADWAYRRLNRDSSGHATVSVTLQQLEAIDRLLMAGVGLDDILSYDEHRLREVYLSVIDASRSGKRHNLRAAALKSFHGFLQSLFGAVDPGSDLFDDVPDDGGVDANCFSRADSVEILRRLSPDHSTYSQRQALAHQAAFLFSSRGTMRREEIRRTRLIDLQGQTSLDLYRRERKDEPLKSSNSVRTIPLGALLTGEELLLVRDYRQLIVEDLNHRRETEGKEIPEELAMLFPKESDPQQAMPETALFNPIKEAIHLVTLDRSLRLQHGRHSSIAYMVLTLLENILPGCAQFVSPVASRDDALALQKCLIGTTDPNSQHYWAVATVAGHSSPDISFGSYFHLCDWLLHYALNAYQPDLLQPDLVAAITGLPANKIDQLQRELGVKPCSAFALVLHKVGEFANEWPASPGDESSRSAQPHPESIGETEATVAIPDRGLATNDGHVLNATQVLALLDDLESLLGKKRSKGKKSKQAKAPAGTTVESIARQHRVEPDSASLLWSIAESLANISGKQPPRAGPSIAECVATQPTTPTIHGQAIVRPLKRVRPPRSIDERQRTNTLYHTLRQARQCDDKAVTDWLVLHWKHGNADTSVLRFGDTAPAKAWLGFWKSITGAPETHNTVGELVLTHRADGRSSAKPPKLQKERWAQELSISQDFIFSEPALLKPKGQTGNGILEIDLAYTKPITKAWAKQKQRKGISDDRLRSSSVALDASAYVFTLLLALDEQLGKSM